jgi:hypothetical protein
MNTRFRKVVFGPFTGAQFEIAKISMKQYMQEIGDLPLSIASAIRDDMSLLSQAEKLTKDQSDELSQRSERLVLTHGVKRVRFSDDEEWTPIQFWFGTQETCPTGGTLATDLGSDLDVLIDQVSKFSFNIQGGEALERFFREAGRADVGPSSKEIRAETVEPTAGRDNLN